MNNQIDNKDDKYYMYKLRLLVISLFFHGLSAYKSMNKFLFGKEVDGYEERLDYI